MQKHDLRVYRELRDDFIGNTNPDNFASNFQEMLNKFSVSGMCNDRAKWFINMVTDDLTSFARSLGI